MALQEFEFRLYKFYKDGKAMIEATRALTECNTLPNCDTTLHDLLIKGWLHGGQTLFADIGEVELRSLFTEVVWLSAAIATRCFKGFESASLDLRCRNRSHESETTDSETVMEGRPLGCPWCHPWFDDLSSKITKESHIEVKQIWTDPEDFPFIGRECF